MKLEPCANLINRPIWHLGGKERERESEVENELKEGSKRKS